MKVSWKKNDNKKKKRCLPTLSHFTDLPFEHDDQPHPHEAEDGARVPDTHQLANEFRAQGDKLAMDGKYREALGKWEAALALTPDVPVLHEQKAQVLLEIGDAWNAVKAATRATELEPSWAEAWVTLGRAQLNFGEPDNAIESFDRALALKPDYEEAQDDRKTASHLVKKRKQLHSSGLSATQNRYVVGEKDESSRAEVV
ncbi:tetratricopeptide repeat protein 33 [Cajanus cajan]|uniref:Tetratricopeptide repeat protein 33 n=1 Tax=Cajanus cajan TaxID=3821 RepID=A0A151RUL0_CAJCA|nr:tetratricopeptide repeat protein 33 [Cajanus cajan]KYP46223.1 Tetratricopeptide repeat protein 33 [Cajanus cajan]